MIIPCLELRRAPTLAYIRACAPEEISLCNVPPLPLYLQHAADISLSDTHFLLIEEKEKQLEFSHDQNVNGDMSMNTDGVQPQFKRSQQSVNIHAISGIAARDVCVLFWG